MASVWRRALIRSTDQFRRLPSLRSSVLYIAKQTDCSPMSNLDRALAEISAIRGQMAQATEFRGYGPLTSGMTGLLALVAAFSQTFLVRDPATHIEAYLILWG